MLLNYSFKNNLIVFINHQLCRFTMNKHLSHIWMKEQEESSESCRLSDTVSRRVGELNESNSIKPNLLWSDVSFCLRCCSPDRGMHKGPTHHTTSHHSYEYLFSALGVILQWTRHWVAMIFKSWWGKVKSAAGWLVWWFSFQVVV